MLILLQNIRKEYILLGLSNNTSSSWHKTIQNCIKYKNRTNLASWHALTNQSLQKQLVYLNNKYKIILKAEDFYDMENKYPEYFI